MHVDVIAHRHVHQLLPSDVTQRLVPEHLLLVLPVLLTAHQVGVAREVLVGVDEERDAPPHPSAPLRSYDAVRLWKLILKFKILEKKKSCEKQKQTLFLKSDSWKQACVFYLQKQLELVVFKFKTNKRLISDHCLYGLR